MPFKVYVPYESQYPYLLNSSSTQTSSITVRILVPSSTMMHTSQVLRCNPTHSSMLKSGYDLHVGYMYSYMRVAVVSSQN